MPERIVITGMGTVNPLGLSVQDTWHNAVQGVSGVGPITLFDTRGYLVRIAGEVKNFIPESYLPPKEARRRDRFEQLARAAAPEAIRQASLEVGDEDAGRVGVMGSSAIGGLNSFQDSTITVLQEGPRRINPYVIPMLMTNGAAGMIAIDYGYKGPCFSVASACASGADGIGIAWTLLRLGVIDIAIAGASEATISPVGVAAFDRVGAMSRRNEEPTKTPQPFDLNRDGLVMRAGAAILVLETEARAWARRGGIFGVL